MPNRNQFVTILNWMPYDATICYLYCQPIGDEQPTMDHVPPLRFFARAIRVARNLNLVTLKTHATCHAAWGRDEEYFFNSVLPVAMDSPSGKAAADDLARSFRRDAGQRLGQMVSREFERRPSGLILPGDMVIKRWDGERVSKVIWKIARGLVFIHTGRCLPEDTACLIDVLGPHDPWPEWLIMLMGEPQHGHAPDVFDYRLWMPGQNGVANVLAMHMWERITAWVAFHDPGCACAQCPRPRDLSQI